MDPTIFETRGLSTLQLVAFRNTFNTKICFDEVDNVDYRYEASRVESFKHWPVSYMEPKKLAAAGFYFTGEADIVRCFDCRVEIYRWMEGDDPMIDHKRESPTCSFISKIPCGNVPTRVDSSTISSLLPEGDDVCGLYDLAYDSSEAYVSLLANSHAAKPKYPEYELYDARLCTFKFWPLSMLQTKEQLSDAGFFYTGKEDQVLCYCCGVGVKDWEPTDDPWEQHAIWLPECNYLLSVKGPDYVKQVTGQSPSEDVASYKKMEQSVGELKEMIGMECYPGSSSQCHDSGISSSNSSVKGSIENLSIAGMQDCKSIDDIRMCKICYNSEMCKLFIPCGHLMACTECANRMKICPLCRAVICNTVQVFFS